MNRDYLSLASKIRSCHQCPFRDQNIEPLVPAYATPPVPVMFIGENPSWGEGQDVPFAERTISGKALNKYYLEPLGLSRSEVWITDLFKCRYPKHVYKAKSKNKAIIQEVTETCAKLWLVEEIKLCQPKVVVSLSDSQVYQHLRRVFNLATSAKFDMAVGKLHEVLFNGINVNLFPMIHPDVSRFEGDGDNRKLNVRRKWAPIHAVEHIPDLKVVFRNISGLT